MIHLYDCARVSKFLLRDGSRREEKRKKVKLNGWENVDQYYTLISRVGRKGMGKENWSCVTDAISSRLFN